jgi:hypothetical protein
MSGATAVPERPTPLDWVLRPFSKVHRGKGMQALLMSLCLFIVLAVSASATSAHAGPALATSVDATPTEAAPAEPAPRGTGGEGTSAVDVQGAPRPGEESGRTDEVDPGDSATREFGRGVLFVPKLAIQLALFPLRTAVWADDRYQLTDLYYRVFYNADRTIGLFPTATYESGLGVAVGARFEDIDLFGEHEHLAFQATTGTGPGQSYRKGLLASLRSGHRLGRLQLGLEASFDRRPSDPFDGIGNGDRPMTTSASIDPLTNDAASGTYLKYQEARVALVGDEHLAGPLHVLGTGALTDLKFGPSDKGAAIDEVYDPAGLVGFEGGVRHAYGELELRLDTRRRVTPWEPADVHSTGSLVAASLGRVDRLDGGTDFWHYGVELQQYLRLAKGPRVLSLRFRGDGVTGSRDEVPLTELPMLGGGTFLRGYPFERFRDRVAAMGSVAYEWDLSDFVNSCVFTDVGRVYSSLDDLTPRGMRVGYGIGASVQRDESFVLEGSLASSIDGGLFLNLSFQPGLDARPRWR